MRTISRIEMWLATQSVVDLPSLVQNLLAGKVLALIRRATAGIRYARQFVKWRLLAPDWSSAYQRAVNHLAWWPLDWVEKQTHWGSGERRRVLYYLWSFPNLSETFIQREIAALRNAGISVEVIAHEVGHHEFIGEAAKSLIKLTHYMKNCKRDGIRAPSRRAFLGKAFRFHQRFLVHRLLPI